MSARICEPVYLELTPVAFERDDLEFVLGAVQERQNAAHQAGVSYGLTDFIREALIEAAQR